MWVEGKRGAHHSTSHYVEAAAIHEAHLSTIRREQRVLCMHVIGFTNPVDVEGRKDVPAQHSDCFHPEAMLDKGFLRGSEPYVSQSYHSRIFI
jgi:hypothetical protein